METLQRWRERLSVVARTDMGERALVQTDDWVLLSNHNLTSIRKQKYIGTWKHNSEAVEGMKQEHRIEDSDGSRGGHFLENIQETTLQATGGDDECTGQPDAKVEQCGDNIKLKVQIKMEQTIHLSDLWEHTITKIFKHDPKFKSGSNVQTMGDIQ